jgi:hypothetical protein
MAHGLSNGAHPIRCNRLWNYKQTRQMRMERELRFGAWPLSLNEGIPLAFFSQRATFARP